MTSLATTRVASYARAVRDALSDLSPEHAHAVLDGLDDHLAEIVAEGAIDLDEVLGPPAVYAAELRASAGLAAAGGPRTDDRGSWGAPDTSLIAGPPDSPLASESSGSRASVRNAVPSSDDRAAEEPRTTDAAARQNNADRSALEQAGVRARRVWSHRGVNSAREPVRSPPNVLRLRRRGLQALGRAWSVAASRLMNASAEARDASTAPRASVSARPCHWLDRTSYRNLHDPTDHTSSLRRASWVVML